MARHRALEMFGRSGNPAFRSKAFTESSSDFSTSESMTLSGTVNKTGFYLLLCFITAAWTWNQFYATGDPASVYVYVIVGIVGGSRLYHGAPALSALGALRSGSDLLYVFVPKVIANPIRSIAPDLIVYPLPDSKITLGNSNKILNFRKNIDSFVIGPGLINQKINY